MTSYFCSHCSEVKEEKFFRKCEECKKMAADEDTAGAYFCNISDNDEFNYKDKQLLCNKCNSRLHY